VEEEESAVSIGCPRLQRSHNDDNDNDDDDNDDNNNSVSYILLFTDVITCCVISQSMEFNDTREGKFYEFFQFDQILTPVII